VRGRSSGKEVGINWLEGESDFRRLVTASLIYFFIQDEFTMGAHRMNNKQKVLFVCVRKY